MRTPRIRKMSFDEYFFWFFILFAPFFNFFVPVQSTFFVFWLFPPPPACSNIFAIFYWPCTRLTSDAGIALIMQGIVRHIAAAKPAGLKSEDIPAERVAKEREIYRARALERGQSERIIDEIVDGQVEKFYKDSCLMSQPYVKDPKLTVEDVTNDLIAKIGENINIRRFARFQLGD